MNSLVERLRSSAKAFREHTVYDSEGDPLRLIVQADECDEAATRIADLETQLKTVLDREAASHARHDAKVDALEAENARLREALEPSGDTKAAYMGEFSFQITEVYSDPDTDEHIERQRKIYVPWTTIKEIMSAIAARAILAKLGTKHG